MVFLCFLTVGVTKSCESIVLTYKAIRDKGGGCELEVKSPKNLTSFELASGKASRSWCLQCVRAFHAFTSVCTLTFG